MNRTLVLLLLLFLTLYQASADACEPCAEEKGFVESAAEADLIIVGQKIGDGPMTGDSLGQSGPDWMRVKVINELKGKSISRQIKVESFQGMCPYGIYLKDYSQYVLFLKKNVNPEQEHEYEAVFMGCGTKTYRMMNGQIVFGDKFLSLIEFMKKIR